MQNGENSELDELLQRYRLACPDVEPGANFMPQLWQKIDARRSFWPVFQGLARRAMAGCAALALLLLALNLVDPRALAPSASTYTDALLADHSVEKTYYAESVLRQPRSDDTELPSMPDQP